MNKLNESIQYILDNTKASIVCIINDEEDGVETHGKGTQMQAAFMTAVAQARMIGDIEGNAEHLYSENPILPKKG